MSEHEPSADPWSASASKKPSSGPEKRRSEFTIKRVVIAVVGVLVLMFAVVNTRQVEVSWIFGSPIQSPLILVIVVSLLAGLVIGYLVARFGRGSAPG